MAAFGWRIIASAVKRMSFVLIREREIETGPEDGVLLMLNGA
jgi:hypothetical protein